MIDLRRHVERKLKEVFMNDKIEETDDIYLPHRIVYAKLLNNQFVADLKDTNYDLLMIEYQKRLERKVESLTQTALKNKVSCVEQQNSCIIEVYERSTTRNNKTRWREAKRILRDTFESGT